MEENKKEPKREDLTEDEKEEMKIFDKSKKEGSDDALTKDEREESSFVKKESSSQEEGEYKELKDLKHEIKKKRSKIFGLEPERFKIIIIAVLVVFIIFNIYQLIVMKGMLNDQLKEMQKEKIPAKVSLLIIEGEDCEDCFDITTTLASLKAKKLEIVEESTIGYDSDEAKELIEKYGLEKFPVIIVTGEIDKAKRITNFIKKEDGFVFDKITPPYTDSDGEIRGSVKATVVLNENCDECSDLNFILDSFEMAGVAIESKNNYDLRSSEGKNLIDKYDIKNLPVLLLDEEIKYYEDIEDAWSQLGTIEEDGTRVLRQVDPPYYEIATKKVRGVVDIIYLVDESCEECYNVTIHRSILTNPSSLNMRLGKEETIDVNSDKGKALIEKYDITVVPTIILAKEADIYTVLGSAWQSVGTIEDDGSYVFREITAMQGSIYRDLETGEILGEIEEAVS